MKSNLEKPDSEMAQRDRTVAGEDARQGKMFQNER